MFKIVDRTTDKCIGLKLEGELRAQDYETLQPILDNAITAHGNINLVLEADDFDGHADLDAVLADVQMSVDAFDHIERVAVISDDSLQKAATTLLDPLSLDTEMEHFAPGDRDAAWTWACGNAWRQ